MAKERQKVRQGRVVSNKMDKTVVVAIVWDQRHRLYRKPVRRVTKFYAHDLDNRCRVGDLVNIQETRPISRLKRWRVIDIVERHDIIEVQPAELGQEELAEVTAPTAQTATLESPEETSTTESLEETSTTEILEEASTIETLEETTPPQDQKVPQPEDSNIQEPTESPDPATLDEEDKD